MGLAKQWKGVNGYMIKKPSTFFSAYDENHGIGYPLQFLLVTFAVAMAPVLLIGVLLNITSPTDAALVGAIVVVLGLVMWIGVVLEAVLARGRLAVRRERTHVYARGVRVSIARPIRVLVVPARQHRPRVLRPLPADQGPLCVSRHIDGESHDRRVGRPRHCVSDPRCRPPFDSPDTPRVRDGHRWNSPLSARWNGSPRLDRPVNRSPWTPLPSIFRHSLRRRRPSERPRRRTYAAVLRTAAYDGRPTSSWAFSSPRPSQSSNPHSHSRRESPRFSGALSGPRRGRVPPEDAPLSGLLCGTRRSRGGAGARCSVRGDGRGRRLPPRSGRPLRLGRPRRRPRVTPWEVSPLEPSTATTTIGGSSPAGGSATTARRAISHWRRCSRSRRFSSSTGSSERSSSECSSSRSATHLRERPSPRMPSGWSSDTNCCHDLPANPQTGRGFGGTD